jgi:hypothetical protein
VNLKFKGLGAEPKKVGILLGLLAVLGYFLYSNVLAPSSDEPPAGPRSAATASTAAVAPAPEVRARPALRSGGPAPRAEFRFGSREKQPDPASIDPTLRLDLLARVQAVALAGGSRNLFQFGAPPMPKAPEPKIVIPRPGGPIVPVANTPPAEPPTPPPPPIALKFYGYTAPAPTGEKRLFFLDGDDIVVAAEGDLIKNRYKVVRAAVNSVVVEDTQFHHQQTLVLEDQPR